MKRVIGLFTLSLSLFAGEKLHLGVKIVGRQNNETQYTYVVPGYSMTNTNGNTGCVGTATDTAIGTTATVGCAGSAQSTTTSRPAQQVSFTVHGATFSLALPDGRMAVVNCESKFAERFAGRQGNRRSCRMPIVDDIQAEFDGDKAKLFWPVSLDGKKIESETYKILGVFAKPEPQQ
jgi:hypothetical protein